MLRGLGERAERRASALSVRMNSKFGSTVTHVNLCMKQHYNGSYGEALESIQTLKEYEIKTMK